VAVNSRYIIKLVGCTPKDRRMMMIGKISPKDSRKIQPTRLIIPSSMNSSKSLKMQQQNRSRKHSEKEHSKSILTREEIPTNLKG
jgi:predicted alpha/beta superfamily hydrolase